jgi:hypothetical protein
MVFGLCRSGPLATPPPPPVGRALSLLRAVLPGTGTCYAVRFQLIGASRAFLDWILFSFQQSTRERDSESMCAFIFWWRWRRSFVALALEWTTDLPGPGVWCLVFIFFLAFWLVFASEEARPCTSAACFSKVPGGVSELLRSSRGRGRRAVWGGWWWRWRSPGGGGGRPLAGGTRHLYLVFGSLCVALLYIYRRDSAIVVSACALVQLTEARSSSRTQHALQYYALI